jgi:hypothetical protein
LGGVWAGFGWVLSGFGLDRSNQPPSQRRKDSSRPQSRACARIARASAAKLRPRALDGPALQKARGSRARNGPADRRKPPAHLPHAPGDVAGVRGCDHARDADLGARGAGGVEHDRDAALGGGGRVELLQEVNGLVVGNGALQGGGLALAAVGAAGGGGPGGVWGFGVWALAGRGRTMQEAAGEGFPPSALAPSTRRPVRGADRKPPNRPGPEPIQGFQTGATHVTLALPMPVLALV